MFVICVHQFPLIKYIKQQQKKLLWLKKAKGRNFENEGERTKNKTFSIQKLQIRHKTQYDVFIVYLEIESTKFSTKNLSIPTFFCHV